MKQEQRERLIRPVKCHFCNQPMFYAGDPKHEPEVHVSVQTVSIQLDQESDYRFYAHVRCWNERYVGISMAAKDYQSTV